MNIQWHSKIITFTIAQLYGRKLEELYYIEGRITTQLSDPASSSQHEALFTS